MPPKHEGHPEDCNDESNQCLPAEALFIVRRHAGMVTERLASATPPRAHGALPQNNENSAMIAAWFEVIE